MIESVTVHINTGFSIQRSKLLLLLVTVKLLEHSHAVKIIRCTYLIYLHILIFQDYTHYSELTVVLYYLFKWYVD